MKYFPLIWAALWRKPTPTILTLLSVTAAFTLFGMMIGFDASVQALVEASRLDRLYIYPHGGGSLPLAYKDQILRLSGVTKIGYLGVLGGYYRDRKDSIYIRMVDDDWRNVMTEYPLTPPLLNRLQASRTNILVSRLIADRYHLKPGDVFPVLTAGVTRQDGGKVWPFTVVGILDDILQEPIGYAIGNYAYMDESRPLAQRGTADFYDALVGDPARAADIAAAVDARFANSPVATDTHVDRAETQSNAQAGINVPFVTVVVSAAGLFMILFLTANAIAQSVRERIPEFAVLKTLGFSGGLVMTLVFAEAAIPCLLGAVLGLGLAAEFAREIPPLMPPEVYLPAPIMPASLLGLALASALLVALLSAAIPALRLNRLDVASALAGK